MKNISFTNLLALVFSALTILLVAGFFYVSLYFSTTLKQELLRTGTENFHRHMREHFMNENRMLAENFSTMFSNIADHTESIVRETASFYEYPEIYAPGRYWRAEDHMFYRDNGAYTNSVEGRSSVFVPSTAAVTEAAARDIEVSAYMDFIIDDILPHHNVTAVYVGTESSVTRYYPNVDLGSFVPPDTDIHERPWYKGASPDENPDRRVIWTDVYGDNAGQGMMITAAKPLYAHDDFIGAAGIDVSLDDIARELERMRTSGYGYYVLKNEHGRIIYLTEGISDLFAGGQGGIAPGDTDDKLLARMTVLERADTGDEMVMIGGKRYHLTHHPVLPLNWTLCGIIPHDDLLKPVLATEQSISEETDRFLFRVFIPIIIVLLLLFLSIFVFVNHRTKRIFSRLIAFSRQLARGNLEARSGINRTDEMGELAKVLDDMSDKLKRSQEDLKKANDGLEQEVARQTRTLREKVKELKRFNDAAVDRELKMIELKKRIRELEDGSVELNDNNSDMHNK